MGHTRKKNNPIRHNGGIIYPHGTQYRACINHNYAKHRAVQPTIADARAWIDATQAELANNLPPLDAWQIREAARALAILPEGTSLIEAAQFFRKKHTRTSISLKAAAEEFLQQRLSEGLRPRSLSSTRHKINALVAEYTSALIHEITTRNLLAMLEAKSIDGVTRNNYRRDWSGFFAWAVRSSYIETNPATDIPTTRIDERLPEIFPPETVKALLEAALDTAPELIPIIAAMTFAGIRPEEARRLLWSDILMDQGLIRIGPHVSKVRQQRYVDIHPTLGAWLRHPDIHPTGNQLAPYASKKLADRMRHVRQKAEIHNWPPDVLRHTYATYHLASNQDPGKTASQLGHRSTDTLFRHYRGLATPQEAKQFWAILPTPIPT